MQVAVEKLENRIAVDGESGCWEWTGARNEKGYGRIWVNHQLHYTHRLAYELFVGPIPDGLQIDHLCRNTSCCNPEHLETVTCRENLLRGETVTARRAATTHCPKGHPYDAENTYIRPGRGGRDCRTCRRARRRKSAQRVRERAKSNEVQR